MSTCGAVNSFRPFRLLGSRGPNDPPLMSPKTITNLETRLEVLGWIPDIEKLTISMTRKLEKLQHVLGSGPCRARQ